MGAIPINIPALREKATVQAATAWVKEHRPETPHAEKVLAERIGKTEQERVT